MPRKATSFITQLIGYFMSAPITEADQSFATVQAVLVTRHAQGLKEPALPLGTPAARPRRVRKPTQPPLPAATTASGPSAASTPAVRRPRRAVRRPRRAVRSPATSANPLPDQNATDQD